MTANDQLIRMGAAAVGSWRITNPHGTIQAAGSTFNGLDLSGINLEKADLRKCQFTNCDLRHCNMSRALLDHAKFDKCNLDSANFSGASVRSTRFEDVQMSGCDLTDVPSLGRIATLIISENPKKAPKYDKSVLPAIDRYFGWDRVRFLSSVSIFVPSYASLTISVLYLGAISWINFGIRKVEITIRDAYPMVSAPIFEEVTPSWIHLGVIASFFFLAVAATTFLACPERISEFSRERWLHEAKNAEILYDQSTWQKPAARLICVMSLLAGGSLGAFLLGRSIVRSTHFILTQLN
ncbi:pentapeptide repeat-containing protein [Rhodobacter lacus]|uniref:Pentapeptide repeat-containing protein n=1 Tax=Rhodobacter lacus TaxID=1641972 RepID=A0ABW5ACB8_9RHOB